MVNYFFKPNKYKDSTLYVRLEATPEFISSNSFSLNKTKEEILDRIKTEHSFLGAGNSILTQFVPFNSIKHLYPKQFIEDVLARKISIPKKVSSIEECAQDFLDCLVYSWEEENETKLRATIEKLKAYVWLMGREDLEWDLNMQGLTKKQVILSFSELIGLTIPQPIKNKLC